MPLLAGSSSAVLAGRCLSLHPPIPRDALVQVVKDAGLACLVMFMIFLPNIIFRAPRPKAD